MEYSASIEIMSETETDYLVFIGNATISLPKSECQIVNGEIVIPRWLARENGIRWPRRLLKEVKSYAQQKNF